MPVFDDASVVRGLGKFYDWGACTGIAQMLESELAALLRLFLTRGLLDLEELSGWPAY